MNTLEKVLEMLFNAYRKFDEAMEKRNEAVMKETLGMDKEMLIYWIKNQFMTFGKSLFKGKKP